MDKKELNTELKMVSAISEALEIKKIEDDNEKVISQISKLVSREKSEDIKLGMIAAASRALDISERNPNMKDKDIIKRVIKQLFSINQEISRHSIKKSKN